MRWQGETQATHQQLLGQKGAAAAGAGKAVPQCPGLLSPHQILVPRLALLLDHLDPQHVPMSGCLDASHQLFR